MMRYAFFALFIFLSATISSAQDQVPAYKFRIYLKDKNGTEFKIDNPGEFLSEKSIARRKKQNIEIDSTDLPIPTTYIKKIEEFDCRIVAKSKWLNTVSVHTEDSLLFDKLKSLPFAENIIPVWKNDKNTAKKTSSRRANKPKDEPSKYHGSAHTQISIHNGDSLHRAGFRGRGMEIAVLDGGFRGLDDNIALENINIKASKNFIYEKDEDYESDHGLRVLSCMATNMPYIFVGTAPDANYWLFQTENPASEYPIEEDYWVAAAEYADSVGVDIINSSLGYTNFNDSLMNHKITELDGKTIFITKGAANASAKGILVVTSAGNEGNSTWRLTSAPADAEEALTVGAVRSDSTLAAFSSRGPTADNRTKPDVMAIGSSTATLTWDGSVGYTSGTSYSSPIMCGLAACLWQAFPHLTNKELTNIIKQSANKYNTPDNDYGNGIPDMIKAMDLASGKTEIEMHLTLENHFTIFSDSTGNITIIKKNNSNPKYDIRIFSTDGKVLLSDSLLENEKTYCMNTVKKDFYIIRIESIDFKETRKIWF